MISCEKNPSRSSSNRQIPSSPLAPLPLSCMLCAERFKRSKASARGLLPDAGEGEVTVVVLVGPAGETSLCPASGRTPGVKRGVGFYCPSIKQHSREGKGGRGGGEVV